MAENLDGEIRIGTTIDTSGVSEGVKDVTNKLKGLKSAGVGLTVAAMTKTFKAAAQEIKKTSNALNTQIKAEKQLQTAAKNNPYLDGTSVKQLQQFASELQKVSTTGDEVLIPLMAQLASAGRTQAEIESIMTAALDVSASGMMSLDSAVTQLNATYSGNIGLMGRQISELKGLTKEELESGKAIDIVSAKFKGMAEETAKATGSFEQMKNAQGDFNEALGKMTKPTADVWNNFWKGWYERGTEAIGKLVERLDVSTIGKSLDKEITKELAKIEDYGGKNDYVKNTLLPSLSDEQLTLLQKYYETQKKLTEDQRTVNNRIRVEVQNREYTSAELKKQQAEQEKLNKQKQEEADRNKAAQDFINENQAALDKQIEKIKLEAQLKGEEANEQEILNAYIQSYIDLVTGSDLVSENNSFSKKRLKELQDYADGITVVTEDLEVYKDALESANLLLQGDSSLADQIQEVIDALKLEAEQFKDNAEQYEEYVNKINELSALKKKTINQELKDNLADITSTINSYFSQFASIVSSVTNLMTSNASKQAEAENKKLQNSYTEGLLSYEEYCQKKKEVSRKLAQEEYKAKMWEWTASILSASANIAEGVTKAIAQGGALGIITGSLVSAAGAVQLASLAANKPQPPAFKEGGVIGGVQGASYGNDNTMIKARTGEMVLNAIQQRELWNMANGSGKGGASVTMPVTVENNASAGISTQLDQNGLRIIVDDLVNTSLQQGKYTQSMQISNNKSKGARYL